MNLFNAQEARYFCNGFRPLTGRAELSLRQYATAHLPTSGNLIEGTTQFDEYRACFLRNTERSLFLAASNYRRAFDLLTVSSSSWAHVTLYYGAFYAAQGLLGLFGSWVDAGKCRVDVARNAPGKQELKIEKGKKTWGTYSGSHQRFWDFFYQASIGLIPSVGAQQVFALQPINNDIEWLIRARNDFNYDTHSALGLSADYRQHFRASTFPASLPGKLKTQFDVLEELLLISCGFATAVGLQTDVLDALSAKRGLRSRIRTLIYDARPARGCRPRIRGVAR